jgi:hypothetical protein
MPELITIPISFIEISIPYQRPDFRRLWIDRGAILQGLFDALAPWNPTVDDVEPISVGKPSEQGVTIKLPLKKISFFFGPASCRFTRDNVAWDMAEETMSILNTCLTTLVELTDTVLGQKLTSISLHFQPRNVQFMTLLGPFIPQQIGKLFVTPVRAMATVTKWDDAKITVDGSSSLPNGIFLKIERTFPASIEFSEIAQELRTMQLNLFSILDVEEAQL